LGAGREDEQTTEVRKVSDSTGKMFSPPNQLEINENEKKEKKLVSGRK
jgi:hypothetical protein